MYDSTDGKKAGVLSEIEAAASDAALKYGQKKASAALDKQIKMPLKPTENFAEHYGRIYKCSSCGGEIIGISNYCKHCGQRLEYCHKV